MGACCGKQSSTNDPFAQPGRTVGSIPAQAPNPTAPIPKKVVGPPRTLGGAPQSTAEQDDARRKAAVAAEARANTGKSKGKLAENLDAQKKQSRVDTLEAVSRENRGARDADSAAETRAYN